MASRPDPMIVRRVALGLACAIGAVAATSADGMARPHPRPASHQPALHPRPTVALGAHESEYRIRLTRSVLPAGRVVVEVQNVGQDPHDLQIARADGTGTTFAFGLAGPGTRRKQALKLTRGSWRLFCSVSGHEARGMSATIVVR